MRPRVVLAIFAAFAILAAAGLYFVVHNLSRGIQVRLIPQQCTANADGTAVVDPDQMANAATIAAVGLRRGVPPRAVVIALSAASQESKLTNLNGGDRDSIGLFQQRPSQGWGTPDQLINPRYAASAFYSALLKVRGWQQMSVADAAQAVQKSADGQAYARWVDQAQILSTALLGDAPASVACTITDDPAQRGAQAASALAQGIVADWGNNLKVNNDAKLPGLEVTASATRTGWQYAHWLVAHAADQGIKRVRFGNQEWTAKGGAWTKATQDPGPAGGERVIAEVYASR